jgi:ABC-type transporter MlaC component
MIVPPLSELERAFGIPISPPCYLIGDKVEVECGSKWHAASIENFAGSGNFVVKFGPNDFEAVAATRIRPSCGGGFVSITGVVAVEATARPARLSHIDEQSSQSFKTETVTPTASGEGYANEATYYCGYNPAASSYSLEINYDSASPRGREKGKPKRKKKDPNQPKRPQSAYLYFASAVRETLRQTNPGLSMAELAKLIGSNWREATAEAKKEFEEMAAKDKLRYAEDMKQYASSLPINPAVAAAISPFTDSVSPADTSSSTYLNGDVFMGSRGPSGAGAGGDYEDDALKYEDDSADANTKNRASKPKAKYKKRPANSFVKFCQAKRQQSETKLFADDLARMWRETSEEERGHYIDAYKREECEFRKGCVAPRPPTAYVRFCVQQRAEHLMQKQQGGGVGYVVSAAVGAEAADAEGETGRKSKDGPTSEHLSALWRAASVEQKRPFVEAYEREVMQWRAASTKNAKAMGVHTEHATFGAAYVDCSSTTVSFPAGVCSPNAAEQSAIVTGADASMTVPPPPPLPLPKRPLTAYIRFSQTIRKGSAGRDGEPISGEEMGRLWREMKLGVKRVYEEAYEDDMKEYRARANEHRRHNRLLQQRELRQTGEGGHGSSSAGTGVGSGGSALLANVGKQGPVNAYIRFCNAKKAEAVTRAAAEGGFACARMYSSEELGKMWKQASWQEKRPFKEAYHREMQLEPKRPDNPYVKFCQARRAQSQRTMHAEELGRMWREASEETKGPFVAAYEIELGEWATKRSEAAVPSAYQRYAAEQRVKRAERAEKRVKQEGQGEQKEGEQKEEAELRPGSPGLETVVGVNRGAGVAGGGKEGIEETMEEAEEEVRKMWDAAGEEERLPFVQAFRQEALEYKARMHTVLNKAAHQRSRGSASSSSGSMAAEHGGRGHKRKYGPGPTLHRPHRPRPESTYIRFCRARRAEAPGVKYTGEELGRMWQAATEEEKKPFLDAFAEETRVWKVEEAHAMTGRTAEAAHAMTGRAAEGGTEVDAAVPARERYPLNFPDSPDRFDSPGAREQELVSGCQAVLDAQHSEGRPKEEEELVGQVHHMQMDSGVGAGAVREVRGDLEDQGEQGEREATAKPVFV